MQWSAVGSPPERLIHKIDLTEGTANSSKYFCINFYPVPVSPINITRDTPVVCTAGSNSCNSGAKQAECRVNKISQGNYW